MDKNNSQAVIIIVYMALSTECPVQHEHNIIDIAEEVCLWLGRNNETAFNESQLMGIILKRRENFKGFFKDLTDWARQEGLVV